MSRHVLNLLNRIYGLILGLAVVTASLFAGYSLWDNAQIYQGAADVQSQIRVFKPVAEEEGGPGFDELREVNPDIIGWITVDGTNVDYPVLQGHTNLEYMSKDIYGEFSLAGSIFLDIRCSRDFNDNYSLIYGHNMANHLMFGDLSMFKDKDFFKENTTATLLVPGESREEYVAAILQISAGTEEIFEPDMWKNDLAGLGEFLEKNSIWFHSQWIEQMKKDPDSVQVTVLVTCSDGSTNDRTVLVLIREAPDKPVRPDRPENPDDVEKPEKPDNPTNPTDPTRPGGESIHGSGPKPTGDMSNPKLWTTMIFGSILFILTFETVERYIKKRRSE